MSFATQMVDKLEALLLANVGVQSMTVDGRAVTYADLLKQYDFWKNKVARETNSRPLASQIDLGSV